MKVRGHFEKQEISVGLSAELPLAYRGPEEKYTLADFIARPSEAHIRYEKKVLDFELEITSDELVESPGRLRCHGLIGAMPEVALSEVEEELRETYKHYMALQAANADVRLLQPAREVTATVLKHVTT